MVDSINTLDKGMDGWMDGWTDGWMMDAWKDNPLKYLLSWRQNQFIQNLI